MLRQPFHLVIPPVARQGFQRLDNARVQRAPPPLHQAPIGHLLREGVLEGVGALGQAPRLVEELRRLKLGEALMQPLLVQLCHGLQQGHRHLRANDCRRLEQVLGLCRQPVDARRQDRLDGGRHRQCLGRRAQAIGSRLAHDTSRLDQALHTLFHKEGVSLRPHQHTLLGGARLPASPRRASRSAWICSCGNGSSRSWV